MIPTSTAPVQRRRHKRWISWGAGATTGTDNGWEKKEVEEDEGLERWVTRREHRADA
jgi:hypothetical protein